MNRPHRAATALLDELRGLAALAVCLFHIGTRAGGLQLVPNGYLAVDFFFMLSGFVLAEAYEARLVAPAGARAFNLPGAGASQYHSPQHGLPERGPPELTLGEFALRRLVRMLPVAMLGTTIGALYLAARWVAAPDRSDPLDQILAGNLLNLILMPKLWQGPATLGELFPANGPLWSLFFELVANFVWAGWLAGRATAVIGAIVAIAAVALIITARRHGTLDMGWESGSLDGGLARVTFGFGVGLLLHRLRHHLPIMDPLAAPLAAFALLYALALPLQQTGWTLFLAMAFLPAVMVLAISAGRYHALPGGAWLGWVSYPLYGIHVPLLAIFAGATKHFASDAAPGGWALLLVVPLLAAAALVARHFDAPLRAALTAALERRRPPPELDLFQVLIR